MRPLCEGSGCPVEDIAPILSAEKLIQGFIKAKILQRTSESAFLYEKALERAGLLDDIELLLKFEDIWADKKMIDLEKRTSEQKARQTLNKNKRRR